jgi:hypothetical protein
MVNSPETAGVFVDRQAGAGAFEKRMHEQTATDSVMQVGYAIYYSMYTASRMFVEFLSFVTRFLAVTVSVAVGHC